VPAFDLSPLAWLLRERPASDHIVEHGSLLISSDESFRSPECLCLSHQVIPMLNGIFEIVDK
jgi:hypothetical protein